MINRLISTVKIEQENDLSKIVISYTQVFSRKDTNGNCHYDYKFFAVSNTGEILDLTAIVYKLTNVGRIVERHVKTQHSNLVIETYDDMAETVGFKLLEQAYKEMANVMVEVKPIRTVLVNLL